MIETIRLSKKQVSNLKREANARYWLGLIGISISIFLLFLLLTWLLDAPMEVLWLSILAPLIAFFALYGELESCLTDIFARAVCKRRGLIVEATRHVKNKGSSIEIRLPREHTPQPYPQIDSFNLDNAFGQNYFGSEHVKQLANPGLALKGRDVTIEYFAFSGTLLSLEFHDVSWNNFHQTADGRDAQKQQLIECIADTELLKQAISTEEFTKINDQFLEFPRRWQHHNPRGLILMAAIFFIAAGMVLLFMLFPPSESGLSRDLGYFILVLMNFFMLAAGIGMFKYLFTASLDNPIRFSRVKNVVYVCSYHWAWNPFTRWGNVIEQYEWRDLETALEYHGGKYPHTNVVVTRRDQDKMQRLPCFTLKIHITFDLELCTTWNVCRKFMAYGQQGIALADSQRIPKRFSPTITSVLNQLGFTREFRVKLRFSPLHASLMYAGIAFIFPFMWVSSWFHFLALRLAPEFVWPDAMDAESKSGLV